jgi:restriction system protein
MSVQPTIWGLHHNRGRSLVEEGVAAIGWEEAGDLTAFSDDRDAFKARLRTAYPNKTENWVANAAGQLRRFRHVMAVGDLIVYPRPVDRTINIGRITGDYLYDTSRWAGDYPNQRPVDWLRTAIPRDAFTQGCLYEVGSAMSVFMVSTHGAEFIAVLSTSDTGNQPIGSVGSGAVEGAAGADAAEVAAEDEPNVARIQDLTRDFVLKRFKTELKGHRFAVFCGWLLESLGYTTQVSPPGADQGVDIIATEDPLGVKPPAIKVQCKSGNTPIGSPDVQALNGTLSETDQGLFVSIGGFSPPARQVAAGMPRMRLMGADELISLVLDHYAELSDEAKLELPLRRVWMPDPPSTAE